MSTAVLQKESTTTVVNNYFWIEHYKAKEEKDFNPFKLLSQYKDIDEFLNNCFIVIETNPHFKNIWYVLDKRSSNLISSKPYIYLSDEQIDLFRNNEELCRNRLIQYWEKYNKNNY